MQFSHGGLTTTVHMSPDLEMFGPHSIIRLIEFFPGILSKCDFWPGEEE